MFAGSTSAGRGRPWLAGNSNTLNSVAPAARPASRGALRFAACPGGLCRQAVKAVEGTAGQPGGDARPGEGDGGAGECLGKVAVGEKRDRQEQVMHRGRAVPALVLIRHVQPAGVIQRKMTDFYQKNTPVKTTRDETEKK